MLGITLIVLIILIIVYLAVPYSGLKKEFNREVEHERAKYKEDNKLLTEEMLQALPEPVKRFYSYAGYIGKQQATELKMNNQDVDFMLDIEADKPVKINYTELIFTDPVRYAFIDARIHGIPFQGIDAYTQGEGSMKGVLAKCIQLFNVKGKEMDESALATWLCAAIFLPRAILNNNLLWRELDKDRVEVTLNKGDMAVTVVYVFDKEGKLLKAETDNRSMTEKDGSFKSMRWSVVFNQYENINGCYVPAKMKCMWKRDNKEIVYFDSQKAEMTFQ